MEASYATKNDGDLFILGYKIFCCVKRAIFDKKNWLCP